MAGGPTQMTMPRENGRWEANPVVSALIRAVVIVTPIAVSIAFGYWASTTIGPERLGVSRLAWWSGLLVITLLIVRLLELLLRHVGPLAVLFRLSLAFPDQTPSRFALALRAGTTTSTKIRIRRLQEEGGELSASDAVSAQMLELLTVLTKHDRMTRGHAERVRSYAELIAQELDVSPDDLDRLRWSALLHDIGKIDVPAEILNKDGRPDAQEWAVLQTHPAAGEKYLEPLSEWLGEWRHAVDGHHERFDGNGYPRGLKGRQIPLSARIVAIADAYDVMTSTRSYKQPLSATMARKEILANAGEQFDPLVVRTFLSVGLGDLRRIAGPVAWFASLPAIRSIPIASATQPIATALVSAAAVASAVVGGVPLDVDFPQMPDMPNVVAFGDDEPPENAIPFPMETVTPTSEATSEPAGQVETTAPASSVAPTTNEPTVTVSAPVTTTTTTTIVTTTMPLPADVVVSAQVEEGGGLTLDVASAHTVAGSTGLTITSIEEAGAYGIATVEGATSLAYLHAGDESSVDYVRYTVEDDQGRRATGRIDIAVLPVNDAPAAADHVVTVPETHAAGPTGYFILATDPDGPSPLSYALNPGSPFALSPAGELLVADASQLDYEVADAYPLAVVISDGVSDVTVALDITVEDVNEPPSAPAQSYQASELAPTGAIVGSFDIVDPEGDAFTVRIDEASNRNLDGDAVPAYDISLTGTTATITIADADDVDHGVSGQAPRLQVIVEDARGAVGTVEVLVATQTRFGLSPDYGKIIISEVRWASTEQFVELVNVSGEKVDVSGWVIADYAWGVDSADVVSTAIEPVPAVGSGLDPGQRVVFYPGTLPATTMAGITYAGNGPDNALSGSDDVWVFDENGRIVAYMAWGDESLDGWIQQVGDRPPIVSWNLWDTSNEPTLGTGAAVNAGQSIALADERAASARSSLCWEPSASGLAAPACPGARTTVDTDPAGNRTASRGVANY